MGNIVKFGGTKPNNSIKSGGFNIAVNNTSSDLTGFYNGITPIMSGYTIYIDKASNGPSIYAPKNDTELIAITKQLGGNVNTSNESLNYINSQSNMTVVNNDYPSIVTSGLVLNLDAGFVSSYPKNGTIWKDLSGNSNNGTLTNGPTFNSGNLGSIVFDGIDDGCFIGVGTNYPYPYHTFEIWVKTSGLGAGMNSAGLIGLDYGRTITINSNGNITYAIYTGVEPNFKLFSVTTSNVNIFDNSWHHIVCSRGSSIYEIYIDGVLKLTGGNGGVPSWNGLNIWSSMGAQIANNPNDIYYKLNGSISTIKMYNRQLTQVEVLQNYYAGLQKLIPTNGLVLSLDAQNTNLYATSPTTGYDISGNNNNGTLLNGVQYVADGNGSWKFDGVDDYINIPNTTSLQVTGDQTLVFWVYPNRRDRRQNFYAKSYGGEGTITYEPNGSMTYYWGIAGSNTSPYQGVATYGGPMLTLNIWYFVVLVRELSTPSKTVKWYINGVLNSTTTAAYTSATAGTSPITIGTGYAGPFLGNVGIVMQYNTALTQTEITTIFNATRSRYGI